MVTQERIQAIKNVADTDGTFPASTIYELLAEIDRLNAELKGETK